LQVEEKQLSDSAVRKIAREIRDLLKKPEEGIRVCAAHS
jgi:hypothetical protein